MEINFHLHIINPFADFYDLNQGPTCKPYYIPIISNWQDCKQAAETLGYIGDDVAHVDLDNSYQWWYSQPQGCFQSDGRRFHFNEGPGGNANADENILCIRKDLGI